MHIILISQMHGRTVSIYCGEENITHQVIVQRRGKDALKDVTQLPGKEVYTTPGKYYDRLMNLNSELGRYQRA